MRAREPLNFMLPLRIRAAGRVCFTFTLQVHSLILKLRARPICQLRKKLLTPHRRRKPAWLRSLARQHQQARVYTLPHLAFREIYFIAFTTSSPSSLPRKGSRRAKNSGERNRAAGIEDAQTAGIRGIRIVQIEWPSSRASIVREYVDP